MAREPCASAPRTGVSPDPRMAFWPLDAWRRFAVRVRTRPGDAFGAHLLGGELAVACFDTNTAEEFCA